MFAGYFTNVTLPAKQTVLAALQNQASPQRLRRSVSYRKTDDQVRCLLSESLLKRALAHQGIAVSDQHIQTTKFGKPVLSANDKQHFNISHSGEWVVCVVDDQPVGIDIEQQVNFGEIELDSLFTAQEMEYLQNGKQSSLRQRFYRLWTLKESYLKALGTGLYQSMQSFTVTVLDNNRAQLSIVGHLQKDWYFYSFELDATHVCSICTRQPICAEQFHFIHVD